MDGRAEATTTTVDRLSKATTTRMVGAGDDEDEDGWEAANEADDGDEEV